MPLAVAAFAAVATLPGATGHALYGDEVASARIVTEPSLGRVLTHVRRTESTPPSWYVAAWAVRETTGAGAESLRLLSVLFAACAAGLTAFWARRLLDDGLAGGVAGLLVALGSVPLEYAEQLRAYALVVLASVAFGVLLVEAAMRPRRWTLIALAAVVWIGALTHYFFLFVVGAGAAWLWIARPRPPARGRATLALGAGLLALAPWLPAFHEQQAHGRYRWIGGFDPLAVAKLPGELFFGPDGLLYGLARLAVTFAVAGAAVALWRRREGSAVVVLALLPIVVAAALWAAGAPIFNERNMLPVVPFLAILVAGAVAELPADWRRLGATAAIAVTIAGGAYAEATLGRVAYDSVARTVESFGWTSRDGIVVSAPNSAIQIAAPMGWYLPGRPELVWRRSKRGFLTRFAIVQVRDPDAWLARYDVIAARVFTYYDHPILGRPHGVVVVARFRRPTRLPGAFFYRS
jgi:4-amino-4-deoxy-L-arabinose transferase-like glycosyltransferase